MHRVLQIGMTAAAIAFAAPSAAAELDSGFQVQVDGSYAIVSRDGKTVLQYRYGDSAPKPYVRELYTPSGKQILRDSPHDHVHHRGLMFGLYLNGVDFWSENTGAGRQVNLKIDNSTARLEAGLARCRIDEVVNWVSDAKPMAVEHRRIDVWAGANLPATLLTWTMQLEPAKDVPKLTISGSHYDGLGARFLTSMDKGGRFENPTGKPGELVRGTEHVVPSKWCAFTGPPDSPVTIAMFDDPQNLRHPAGMFTMAGPFSYLSATPNVWKEPFELTAGSKLTLSYGVALWDGVADAAAVEQLYTRWLGLVTQSKLLQP